MCKSEIDRFGFRPRTHTYTLRRGRRVPGHANNQVGQHPPVGIAVARRIGPMADSSVRGDDQPACFSLKFNEHFFEPALPDIGKGNREDPAADTMLWIEVCTKQYQSRHLKSALISMGRPGLDGIDEGSEVARHARDAAPNIT